MAAIYRATASFVLDLNGRRYAAHKGRTTVEEGHPLLEARPGAFRPLVADLRVADAQEGGQVEQATAAPGEKRDAPPLRASKKATAKKASKKATAKKATASKDADDADGDGGGGEDGGGPRSPGKGTAEGAADAPTLEPEANPEEHGSTADDE